MNEAYLRQILIELKVLNNRRSLPAAYFLWLFFSPISGHRWYLKKRVTAGVQMGILYGSFLGYQVFSYVYPIALSSLVLAIPLLIWAFWMLYDGLALPKLVAQHASELRERYEARFPRVPHG
ncbi:MAG: hypothetical protein KKH72_13800 [Alphaproteobacteria bacterium]|nr:hypothetical protein [Alphaproteobacteria bacterium]